MLIQRELESESPVSITNPKQQNYMYINETIQALNFTLQSNRLKPIMTQVLLATLALVAIVCTPRNRQQYKTKFLSAWYLNNIISNNELQSYIKSKTLIFFI